MVASFFLAGVLSLVEFFSEHLERRIGAFQRRMVSLNGGIMLGFLFLVVFPALLPASDPTGMHPVFFLLTGFCLFHLAEKFVYRHAHSHEERSMELGMLTLAGVYTAGLIEGMALFFSIDLIESPAGPLLFVPLFLNAVNASLLMAHISRTLTKSRVVDALLASGPLVGYSVATLLSAFASVAHPVFALVSGTLLYVVVRDILPRNFDGDTGSFVAGVLLSMLLSHFAVGFV